MPVIIYFQLKIFNSNHVERIYINLPKEDAQVEELDAVAATDGYGVATPWTASGRDKYIENENVPGVGKVRQQPTEKIEAQRKGTPEMHEMIHISSAQCAERGGRCGLFSLPMPAITTLRYQMVTQIVTSAIKLQDETISCIPFLSLQQDLKTRKNDIWIDIMLYV